MRLRLFILKMVLGVALLTAVSTKAWSDVVNFDELSLASNSFYDGYGSNATGSPWTSIGVEFNTGVFTGGWSYSNVVDTTTPGFTNQWAAFTGTDFSGNGNYALANSFTANSAFINLPTNHELESLRITNTTYAAISMRDGDSFAKQFGGDSGDDPDFFRIIFNGFTSLDATGTNLGSVEFYLADYRFTNNSLDYIVGSWQDVSLASLTGARSIGIEFESSDVGEFGINTPAYFAIDNLQLNAVPEPGGLVFLSMAATLISLQRRKNRNC